VARKGRARRFREVRQLEPGYDDRLFTEVSGTLADLEDADEEDDDLIGRRRRRLERDPTPFTTSGN
jgi:hypothetical protein